MNLTGTENAVRILKELVANWDKIRAGLFATRSIKGSGIAQVTNSSDGVGHGTLRCLIAQSAAVPGIIASR